MSADVNSLALEAAIMPAWNVTVPHLVEYFGVWAMHEPTLRATVQRVRGMNLEVHVGNQVGEPQAAGSREYALHRGVAIVSVEGPMMKRASSLAAGTGTIRARRALRAAGANEDVTAVLLRWDTPGGTVSGTADFADDIAAVAKRKPVYSYIEDLCASAGFWCAAQANKVFINRSGLTGSIGTYSVVHDQSEEAKQLGVKVHVIRAGEYKGAGTPGTEITEEQLAEWQRIVNELNSHFLAGVASGRGLAIDRVRELADGRVHGAKDAKRLGLVDAVQTLDETFDQLVSLSRSRKGARAMSQQENSNPQNTTTQASDPPPLPTQAAGELLSTETQPATLSELRESCVGADSDFVLSQLDRKATLAEAQKAWATKQQERYDAQQKELEEAKSQAKRPGVAPVGTKSGDSASSDSDGWSGEGSAKDVWDDKVQSLVAKGMSRQKASSRVNRQNPGLREAMLQEHNAAFGRTADV